PDLFQQYLAGEHLPRFARQAHQQVEFQRGQVDQFLTAQHPEAGYVDGQVPDGQLLRAVRVAPAKAGLDAGDQFGGLGGFDYVDVRVGLPALVSVGGVPLGGEHDDRDAGLGANPPADLDAVHAREHQIQQDDVRLLVAVGLDRLGTVGAERRLVPFRL